MKITCQCGALLVDQTDALPHKGHLIPDQEWLPLLEAVDSAIDQVAAGRLAAEAACMQIRRLLGAVSRLAYQCRQCGRLLVDDREHQLHTFAPVSTETTREILRSRG